MDRVAEAGDTFGPNEAAVVRLLAEAAAVKYEALRDLSQAIAVARDALQPLADNRPVSGPAQRALVTMALMSLGQAAEAIRELEVVATAAVVAREVGQIIEKEP